jgi:predicted DNA-binding transcriptional regulator YafY
MDRTERLLDLVVTLLDATEPVPFSLLREHFADYQGSPSASERKFERDKEVLLSIGVPVRSVKPEGGESGYVVDLAEYQGPAPAVDWAQVATAAARLALADDPTLASALRKLCVAASPTRLLSLADCIVPAPKRPRAATDAASRVARLLTLLPALARRPGVRIAELAAELRIEHKALARELRTLAMAGRPPFGPGDYLDVTVERGRVTVGAERRFARAPRLTGAERDALRPAPPVDQVLLRLAVAVVERADLEVEYSGARARLRPTAVFRHEARWYLVGREGKRRRVLQVEGVALV